jgi:CHAT domain-containing protein/tetratricopeptide (TPR) repeat protein
MNRCSLSRARRLALLAVGHFIAQATLWGSPLDLENTLATLDTLKVGGQWDPYEAGLRELLADPRLAESPADHARVAVRLAQMLHSVRQGGYEETDPLLAEAIAAFEACACAPVLEAEAHAQRAVALLRLQRFEEAVDSAATGARLARLQLAAPDVAAEDRLLLYNALNLEASAYMMTGDERRARPIFEDLVRRFEAEAPDHPRLGVIYVNYGAILYNFGRFRELAEAMAKADRIFAPIPNPVAKAAVKSNWGLALAKQGKWAEAEPLLAAGAAEFEAIGATSIPIYANAVQDWGVAAGHLGRPDEALERINRALELRIGLFGPDNHEVSSSLAQRARVHLVTGDTEAALADSARAVEIIDQLEDPGAHLDLQLIVREIRLRVLAATEASQVDREAAFLAYEAALRGFTRRQLSYGHEGERLAFLQLHDPFSAAVATDNPALIGETLLRFQGLVSDALLEDLQLARTAEDPELANELEAWRAALLSGETDPGAFRELEARLATRSSLIGVPRRALDLSLADLRGHAAESKRRVAVLVPFKPWKSAEDAAPSWGVWSLSSTGEPRWREIGTDAHWQDRIARLQLAIQGDLAETVIREVATELEFALDADSTASTPLHLVPDGIFHQVPFNGLPTDDGSFWAVKYPVLLIPSPRALMPRGAPANVDKSAHNSLFAILGDPFAEKLAVPDAVTTVFRSGEWSSLPEATEECRELAELGRKYGWQSDLRLGNAATEAAFSALQEPRFLHLATHGFQLPSPAEDEPFERLARSGLVWAEPDLSGWTTEAAPFPANPRDGLLSALEIMPRDLTQLELVTLAACASARGAMAPREGLYSLPQAFRRAGAAAVVSALWDVRDDAARTWMTHFYAKVFAGTSISEAYLEATRESLASGATNTEATGLASAIRLGAPWTLLLDHVDDR